MITNTYIKNINYKFLSKRIEGGGGLFSVQWSKLVIELLPNKSINIS